MGGPPGNRRSPPAAAAEALRRGEAGPRPSPARRSSTASPSALPGLPASCPAVCRQPRRRLPGGGRRPGKPGCGHRWWSRCSGSRGAGTPRGHRAPLARRQAARASGPAETDPLPAPPRSHGGRRGVSSRVYFCWCCSPRSLKSFSALLLVTLLDRASPGSCVLSRRMLVSVRQQVVVQSPPARGFPAPPQDPARCRLSPTPACPAVAVPPPGAVPHPERASPHRPCWPAPETVPSRRRAPERPGARIAPLP